MSASETGLLLPWSISEYGAVVDANGKTVQANGFASVMDYCDAQVQSRARSAFIVEAVNAYGRAPSHAALLAEVERLRGALEWIRDNDETGPDMYEWSEEHNRYRATGKAQGPFGVRARDALDPLNPAARAALEQSQP